MEKEFDINNPTPQDFMEMATYVAMSEKKNIELLEELRKHKAYLTATIQQRNSAEAKYQALLAQQNAPIIPITEVTVMNTELNLVNPEQWAVPKGKVITTPKSNKL
jgi:hypothetical protein